MRDLRRQKGWITEQRAHEIAIMRRFSALHRCALVIRITARLRPETRRFFDGRAARSAHNLWWAANGGDGLESDQRATPAAR
jgi:hypothetical protein